MNIWLIMLFGGWITFGLRFSMIFVLDKVALPETLRHSLRFIPPAVLSAIIFPELFIRSGHLDVSTGNSRLIAGAIATLVAWFTKNTLLTIIAGLITLLILQAFSIEVVHLLFR